MKRIKQFGAAGAVISGLLCFTPLLAVGLGTLGLGWLTLYADVAIGIVFIACVGLLSWGWLSRRRAA